MTYTVSLGANRAFKQIMAMCYTPPSAASLDGTSIAAASSDSTPSSGNQTTTSSDGVSFAGYAEYGQATVTEFVNGVAESQLQRANAGAARNTAMWSVPYSAGFTGEATATLGGSELATIGLMSFGTGGGGGGAVLRKNSLLRVGVGR